MSHLYRLRSRVLWLRHEAWLERQQIPKLERNGAPAWLVAEHETRLAYLDAKTAEAEARLALLGSPPPKAHP